LHGWQNATDCSCHLHGHPVILFLISRVGFGPNSVKVEAKGVNVLLILQRTKNLDVALLTPWFEGNNGLFFLNGMFVKINTLSSRLLRRKLEGRF
jgi:hypothetical protein